MAHRPNACDAVVKSLSLALGVPPALVRVVSDAAIAGIPGTAAGSAAGTAVCVGVRSYTPELSAAVQVGRGRGATA
jgi:hypothetical protein